VFTLQTLQAKLSRRRYASVSYAQQNNTVFRRAQNWRYLHWRNISEKTHLCGIVTVVSCLLFHTIARSPLPQFAIRSTQFTSGATKLLSSWVVWMQPRAD